MNFLIFYPGLAFILACTGLLMLTLIVCSPAPWSTAVTMIALIPVMPIITVQMLASLIVQLCDWLVEDRIWTMPSTIAARWLVGRLGRVS